MAERFALVGTAGFIAPRHLRAIKELGGEVVLATDPHDAVGVLDSYFPGAEFFTEFEQFEQRLFEMNEGADADRVTWMSICSPNHLHPAHVLAGMRGGCNVICEKPLALTVAEVRAMERWANLTGRKVYTVLQLRNHPSVRKFFDAYHGKQEKTEVELTYVTSRGKWYDSSWKGRPECSGGILTNIGIHFFDMLIWVFGQVQSSRVEVYGHDYARGSLELERAKVQWTLSIRDEDLPEEVRKSKKKAHRRIVANGQELEFSDGFADLHTEVYRQVLQGSGCQIADALPAVALVEELRLRAGELR